MEEVDVTNREEEKEETVKEPEEILSDEEEEESLETVSDVIDDETDEDDFEVVETKDDGTMLVAVYQKSFSAKVSLATEETRNYYKTFSHELNNIKDTNLKLRFSEETLYLRNKPIARLKIKGKTLYLYLKLVPTDERKIENVGDVKKY
ncbi:MAG: hypothetical protein RBQ97_11930 [Acholeplasma sp.]|nr:hypothetical protein [Acholeplasma sp.]